MLRNKTLALLSTRNYPDCENALENEVTVVLMYVPKPMCSQETDHVSSHFEGLYS